MFLQGPKLAPANASAAGLDRWRCFPVRRSRVPAYCPSAASGGGALQAGWNRQVSMATPGRPAPASAPIPPPRRPPANDVFFSSGGTNLASPRWSPHARRRPLGFRVPSHPTQAHLASPDDPPGVPGIATPRPIRARRVPAATAAALRVRLDLPGTLGIGFPRPVFSGAAARL